MQCEVNKYKLKKVATGCMKDVNVYQHAQRDEIVTNQCRTGMISSAV